MRQLLNRDIGVALFFAFVEQAIVASSTICIAKLGQSLVDGSGALLWLVLFVASMTVVFLPCP